MGKGDTKKSYFLKGSIVLFFRLGALMFCALGLRAQQTAVLPQQFTHFFKTWSLINPASIGHAHRSEFTVGNKSLVGAFSGVRTFYSTGHFRLNRDSALLRHVVGMTFVNDKEGTYIHRSRGAMQYAVHIPLGTSTMLSTGIAAGFINYVFSSTNISAGGSAFAPNLDAGCWLYRETFHLGFSAGQLIPSTLTPIAETYRIGKFCSVSADKTFRIHPDFFLTPAAIFRYESKENYNADAALILLLYNNATFAVTYKYSRGGSVSGGLDNIKIGGSIMKLMVSYYSPIGGAMYYNPQAYDLLLSFVPGGK